MPCLLRQYSAALAVLHLLLGQEWFDRNIIDDREGVFLRPFVARASDGYKHGMRVIALAEALYNLLSIDGLEKRLVQIGGGSVEANLGELQAACLLYRSGIPFRFVRESGVKGTDYDVEALIGGTTIACEMKTKLETTTPSATTVAKALQAARSGLPKNGPSLVFLRVPGHWEEQDNARAALEQGIQGVLRNTGRIARVIVHWERWITLGSTDRPEGIGIATVFKQFKNPKTRELLTAIDAAVESWPHQNGIEWADFGALVCNDEDHQKSQLIGTAMSIVTAPSSKLPLPLFRGSLAKARALQPSGLSTILEFRCDELVFVEDLPPQHSYRIDLPDWPNVTFTLVFVEEPNLFRLAVPLHLLDDDLEESDGSLVLNAARTGRSAEALRTHSGTFARDPLDPVLLFLRRFFSSLHSEGDIVRPVPQVVDLAAYYRDEGAQVTVFQINYPGPPIRF